MSKALRVLKAFKVLNKKSLEGLDISKAGIVVNHDPNTGDLQAVFTNRFSFGVITPDGRTAMVRVKDAEPNPLLGSFVCQDSFSPVAAITADCPEVLYAKFLNKVESVLKEA